MTATVFSAARVQGAGPFALLLPYRTRRGNLPLASLSDERHVAAREQGLRMASTCYSVCIGRWQ